MKDRFEKRGTGARGHGKTVRAWLVLSAVLCPCAPVALSAQCPNGTPPPCVGTATVAPPAYSVAVLPFATPPDSADAYLADGIADAIALRLTGVARLAIVSRTDVRRLRQAQTMLSRDIGRALNAAWLVSGRATRAGGRLTVTAELVRSGTGRSVWSRQFQLSQSDLLALADSASPGIATAIVGPLRAEERDRLAMRPTRNPRAYELFLRTTPAMSTVDSRVLQEAMSNLQAALAIDPSFMPAVGRMGYFYGWAVNWGLSMPGIAAESLASRGLEFSDRAIAADSSSADSWLGRGQLLMVRSPPDYPGAIDAMRRAVRLDSMNPWPHMQFAVILRRLGDYESSQDQYHRAVALEPHFGQALADLGFIALTMRRYREAVRWYDSSLVMDPRWQNQAIAARVHAAIGDGEGARRLRDAALDGVPFASRALAIAAAAQVTSALGDTATARETFAPIAAGIGDDSLGVREGFEFALAYTAIGEKERALAVLEHIRPRGAWLWSYLVMPWFDPLRAEPRFQRVLREATPPGAPRM